MFLGCVILTIIISVNGKYITSENALVDPTTTLECHRRSYTYKVTQEDHTGKQCWDTITVMACWGRCDSSEISDWRFPNKKSNHPVCVHHGRNKLEAILRHCEEGVHPSIVRYEYYEAASCRCETCSSSNTSCEGFKYRPHRLHPDVMGFDDTALEENNNI